MIYVADFGNDRVAVFDADGKWQGALTVEKPIRVEVDAEAGTVYVIAALPDRIDLLAENATGNSIFATPVAVDDRLYVRTAIGEGADRQEYLIATSSATLQQQSDRK